MTQHCILNNRGVYFDRAGTQTFIAPLSQRDAFRTDSAPQASAATLGGLGSVGRPQYRMAPQQCTASLPGVIVPSARYLVRLLSQLALRHLAGLHLKGRLAPQGFQTCIKLVLTFSTKWSGRFLMDLLLCTNNYALYNKVGQEPSRRSAHSHSWISYFL